MKNAYTQNIEVMGFYDNHCDGSNEAIVSLGGRDNDDESPRFHVINMTTKQARKIARRLVRAADRADAGMDTNT